jgi:hypothetical protein
MLVKLAPASSRMRGRFRFAAVALLVSPDEKH